MEEQSANTGAAQPVETEIVACPPPEGFRRPDAGPSPRRQPVVLRVLGWVMGVLLAVAGAVVSVLFTGVLVVVGAVLLGLALLVFIVWMVLAGNARVLMKTRRG